MSSQEEDKKVESFPCTKCQKLMKILNNSTLPVELTCGHEVYVSCIIKEIPDEQAEICCQVCNTA